VTIVSLHHIRRADTFAVQQYLALNAVWFWIVTGAVVDLTLQTTSVARFVRSSQMLIWVTAIKRSIFASEKVLIPSAASDKFLVFGVSEQFAAVFLAAENILEGRFSINENNLFSVVIDFVLAVHLSDLYVS
jgi:hypothetical protein